MTITALIVVIALFGAGFAVAGARQFGLVLLGVALVLFVLSVTGVALPAGR